MLRSAAAQAPSSGGIGGSSGGAAGPASGEPVGGGRRRRPRGGVGWGESGQLCSGTTSSGEAGRAAMAGQHSWAVWALRTRVGLRAVPLELDVGEAGAGGEEVGEGGVGGHEVGCAQAAGTGRAGNFGDFGVEGLGSAKQITPPLGNIPLESKGFEFVGGELSGSGGVMDGEPGGVNSSPGSSDRSDSSLRPLNI